MEEESKEEMKETIQFYGVEELIEQYVMNGNAGEVLTEYVKLLEIKLQKIEKEIESSDMGTAVQNIIEIVKE